MKYMDAGETEGLETREAARQLGISPRQLYELIDAGELPAYKAGRNIKIRQADVDSLRARRRPAG